MIGNLSYVFGPIPLLYQQGEHSSKKEGSHSSSWEEVSGSKKTRIVSLDRKHNAPFAFLYIFITQEFTSSEHCYNLQRQISVCPLNSWENSGINLNRVIRARY